MRHITVIFDVSCGVCCLACNVELRPGRCGAHAKVPTYIKPACFCLRRGRRIKQTRRVARGWRLCGVGPRKCVKPNEEYCQNSKCYGCFMKNITLHKNTVPFFCIESFNLCRRWAMLKISISKGHTHYYKKNIEDKPSNAPYSPFMLNSQKVLDAFPLSRLPCPLVSPYTQYNQP